MISPEKKTNVAFFAEKLYGGGVEKILQTILRNFDYERYDVTLYSSCQEVLKEELYPTHINHYHYFSSSKPTFLGKLKAKVNNKIKLFVYYHFSPKWFYRIFIRKKYDIGIAFIEGYATRILSGGPKSMKKIAWIHIELSTFHWTEVAYRNLSEEKLCYQHIDSIACVSSVVKQQADEIFKIANKSIILYNPIESEVIKFQSLIECPISKCPQEMCQLITLGTLNQRKGHFRLLNVVKRLIKENYNIGLLVLGEGEERNKLESQIKDSGIEGQVKLLGYHDNPYPFIENSDIYVCSSYAEGYNTAITEALVLGKAVVSTECSGVKEQLGENNEWGICTPNTEEGLYQGIKQMLSGNNLAHYTRQAEIRGKDFTLDKSMNEIYKLIDE